MAVAAFSSTFWISSFLPFYVVERLIQLVASKMSDAC